jgi:hypothetical protein
LLLPSLFSPEPLAFQASANSTVRPVHCQPALMTHPIRASGGVRAVPTHGLSELRRVMRPVMENTVLAGSITLRGKSWQS